MKLAVVCPKEYQSILGTLGMSFHLVDAYKAASDQAYLEWYKASRGTGQFIILDNGAAEIVEVDHGKAMEGGVKKTRDALPFETVLHLAEVLNADEIILPDMKMDSKWTVKHSSQAALSIAPRKRAVVPQGTNWTEWTACLKLLMNLEPATICVSKDYEELEGGRAEAIKIIKELGHFDRCHVHLLGLKAIPPRGIKTEVEEILRMHPSVRSLDTGAPIAYAQHDVTIEDHRIRFSLDWTSEFQFNVKSSLIIHNIMALNDWCQGA
jgi:hypothetical protein